MLGISLKKSSVIKMLMTSDLPIEHGIHSSCRMVSDLDINIEKLQSKCVSARKVGSVAEIQDFLSTYSGVIFEVFH